MNWLLGGTKAVDTVVKQTSTFDSKRFFEVLRPFFGGYTQEQVDGINGIIKAFKEVGDGDIDTLAYALATAYHETGRRMVPVREGFAKTDKGAISAVAKLARSRGANSAPAKYGKPAGPYGHVYYGRGHVQLTWHHNYRNASKDAGVDLEKYPDKMLDPEISAKVLIRGIMDGRWNGQGKGIDFYEGEDDKLDRGEATQARRLVNVQDKALTIAVYFEHFYNALKASGFK
jgi:Chitinase class I